MIVLGIDPGTATTGYGVLRVNSNNSLDVVTWGLIETDKGGYKEKRLEHIFDEVVEIIKKYTPDFFVMEKVFFASNAKTAIDVGQAQGVMLLAASRMKVKVIEYAPATVKKIITGNGKAGKKDIQRQVRKLLGNGIKSKAHKKTHFDNAADALAIALTYILSVGGRI
jgi:crossover junction endodeoxyribonuclease RuvC